MAGISDDGTSVAMHIIGGVSCASSLCVMVVVIYDKELRTKIYNQVILYIAVCDFVSGFAAGFGLVRDKTPLCWTQAVLTNIFPIAGVMWTTVIACMLYNIVTSREALKNLPRELHLLCWGLPVILTILPMSTIRYGTYHGGKYGWCFMTDRHSSPDWILLFWVIASFYFWIWSSLFVYCILYMYVLFNQKPLTNPLTIVALKRLCLYPLSVILCWITPTFYDISRRPYDRNITYNFAYLSPIFQGTFTALIFFSTNEEARHVLWRMVFGGRTMRQWSSGSMSDDGDVSIRVTLPRERDGGNDSGDMSGMSSEILEQKLSVVQNPVSVIVCPEAMR